MIRKAMKGTIFAGALFAAAVLFGAAPIQAEAKAPKVESVEYETGKEIDVDFRGKVQYKNAKVTVKDKAGKSYKTVIIDKEKDSITVKVSSIKVGKDYKVTVSGVRKKGTGAYGKVTASLRVAGKNEVLVEDVEYDRHDKEVNFDFQGFVKWKKAKVKITDPADNNVVIRIEEKDRESVEVKVKKLTAGKKYKYTITGVARKGSSVYKKVTGTFHF